ncbi:MAG TPA: GGDEF domain-containing protein [Methylotenera sp.]|nr:GGDEF domain-containing protein [Methylotenera sp.]
MFAALEFKTMLFMSGVLAAALSLLLLAIHQHTTVLKGLKHWVCANFLISFAIIIFIQSDTELQIRSLFGGLLMVTGLGMYYVAIRIFEPHPIKLPLLLKALGFLIVCNLIISFYSENEYASVVFNTALCIVITLTSAIYLLRQSRHKRNGQNQFTGICFLVFTGLTIYRFYVLASDTLEPVEHLTSWDLNEFTFLACMLSVLAINFGFIAMVNQRLAELLEYSAGHDWLTGTMNRKKLEQTAEMMAVKMVKSKRSQAMLLMDLDKFKLINDTYGHLFGDTVIKAFSEVVKDNVREVDLIGRYGGEEFCVLMPDSSEDEALILAERIRRKFQATPIIFNDKQVKCTVSIGVCDSSIVDGSFKDMFSAADQSLYAAKNSGRNKIVAYSRLAFIKLAHKRSLSQNRLIKPE